MTFTDAKHYAAGFNLTIELLIFSSHSEPQEEIRFYGFNLTIELLIFSSAFPSLQISPSQCFNLTIELLIFSSPDGSYAETREQLMFQSHNWASYLFKLRQSNRKPKMFSVSISQLSFLSFQAPRIKGLILEIMLVSISQLSFLSFQVLISKHVLRILFNVSISQLSFLSFQGCG